MTDEEKAECIRLISEANNRFITQFVPLHRNTSYIFNETAREYAAFIHNLIQHLESPTSERYSYTFIITLIEGLNTLMNSESDYINLPSLTSVLISFIDNNAIMGDISGLPHDHF